MGPGRKQVRALRAIETVERAYRLDGTEAEWLDGVVTAAWPDIDTGCGVYAFTNNEDVPNFQGAPVFAARELDPGIASRLEELNRAAPPEVAEWLRAQLVTCGGLEQTLGPDHAIVKSLRLVMEPENVKDGFSLFARDAQGGSITMAALSRSAVTLAPRVRGIWRRVGLHVASALRLRRKLAGHATVREALLDPSGKVQDASKSLARDPSAQAVLVRAVAAMEKARSAEMRDSPERAFALWKGLVAGEWSLVDHWESGGRRYLAAYRNRPELRDPRALTQTECAMLKYLALGATNKDIAFALGLPGGTVSSSVIKLMKKLGVKHRVDLALLADPSRMDRLDLSVADAEVGVLAVDARPRGAAAEALSIVELEVTSYVVRGWSNERIAAERQVSPRTIANQLRAIYEKLGVTNRRELVRAVTPRHD